MIAYLMLTKLINHATYKYECEALYTFCVLSAHQIFSVTQFQFSQLSARTFDLFSVMELQIGEK